MDCFWFICDSAGRVESVTKIVLGASSEGSHVTWANKKGHSGKWSWCQDIDGTGYLLIEFAAGNGPWKRHLLQQVDKSIFKLCDIQHPWYTVDIGLWASRGSQVHNNKSTVYMQQFDAPVEASDSMPHP